MTKTNADTTLIAALDAYQHFLDRSLASAKHLSAAHFTLSQARNADPLVLGHVCYDYRMTALNHIACETESLTLVPTPPPASTQTGCETDEEEKPAANPLFWFGALPKPALRKAQTEFQSALPDLVAAANARLRLVLALHRHQQQQLK
ncbi:hypothetical protein BC828DRAFT_405450 [Blastocladiella britannica]|nr:hypothetical protein BC828DRAFT_405450 [Blastocladiella britannica]